VEETGAAQHFRDVRITTIYEGTTGIQANDLVGRKILKDGGQALGALIADIKATVAELGGVPALAPVREALAAGLAAVEGAAGWLAKHHGDSPAVPGAVAVNFLMLLGTVTGGWQLARAALVASSRQEAGGPEGDFLAAKLLTARFYAEQILPLAGAYRQAIEAGADTLMAFPDDQF
jgi:hypothetical protein